jgi:hypothetical protein
VYGHLLDRSEIVVPLTGLDAEACRSLESELMALAGVQQAHVEPSSGDVWIIREPGSEPVPLEVAVRTRLEALGYASKEISTHIAVPVAEEPRRRVRFVEATRTEDISGRVTISVSLEWDDQVHSGTASGERGEVIELKTTGEAAVRALEAVVSESLGVRIIGVKRMHAFDTDLMVASLLRSAEAPRRLVGAVVFDGDAHRAVAVAVLSALNRTLGNFLRTGD